MFCNLEHLNYVILKLYILIELGCTFLMRQPLHQLKLCVNLFFV
jgi:hypothetical protein